MINFVYYLLFKGGFEKGGFNKGGYEGGFEKGGYGFQKEGQFY